MNLLYIFNGNQLYSQHILILIIILFDLYLEKKFWVIRVDKQEYSFFVLIITSKNIYLTPFDSYLNPAVKTKLLKIDFIPLYNCRGLVYYSE